ncbi:MAG: putative lipid II flippase FtsW [Bdellovibrionales bacterium]|nr:putative lipid II flippase FtsW [Bdellovibrionales bacterium]
MAILSHDPLALDRTEGRFSENRRGGPRFGIRSNSTLTPSTHSHIDIVLLALTIGLLGFGLVMLYSTTGVTAQERFGDPLYFLKRQIAAGVIGFVLMLVAYKLPPRFWRFVSPYCFPLALALLIFPLIPGIGQSGGGASRWVSVAGVRFQPGEVSKLCFILFLAGYFARHETKLESFSKGVFKPLLLVAPVAILYLSQPDFGSFSLVLIVGLIMALAAGVRLRYLVISGVGALFAMGILVLVSPYRMKRVLSFLEPAADASGKGYQLIQSLIAVGSGQLTGVGLGGSQQKLFFLPAAHTDFIFSVIAEELGFLGGLGVIVVFLLILWRGLSIAARYFNNTFFFSLTVGLTMLIALPAFLNVGVATGLLPTKGMVLPLVSYGGTNLVVTLIAMGILLSLAKGPQSTE